MRDMTVCPSGQGDGLEIHWALPAGVRIPSLSSLVFFSCVRFVKKNSATGTRTRVARVRAEYPNQLDYSGFWQKGKNEFIAADGEDSS